MPALFSARASGDSSWTAPLLLTLLVALPTAAVLWLVREATQNERLAVRQRLVDVYRGQLDEVRARVAAKWHERLAGLDRLAAQQSAREAFAVGVRERRADSLVFLDRPGQPGYPPFEVPTRPVAKELDEAWITAEQLEQSENQFAAAAEAYGRYATSAKDPSRRVAAIQAQTRALMRAGKIEAATTLAAAHVNDPKLAAAASPDGRWIVGDLMLLIVDNAPKSSGELAEKTAAALALRLNDYRAPLPAAAQRRFLMRELERHYPGRYPFPTLAAEDLAAEYLTAGNVGIEHSRIATHLASTGLRPHGDEGIWEVASPGWKAIALFRTETLRTLLGRELEQAAWPGVQLTVHAPGEEGAAAETLLSTAVGPQMPRWRIGLSLTGSDPFAQAAAARSSLYLTTAAVTLLGTAALALLAALAVRKQTRLARLKNDLVATVSHELKTPLAAMRVLVDTLVDRPDIPEGQSREYLELIAEENARLSRLIDNFLTFSRLEQRGHRLTLVKVKPEELAQRAADVVKNRLASSNSQFTMRLEPDLPEVEVDADAMVTALVNLLDNAIKYSGIEPSDPPPKIALRAFAENNHVCLAVDDAGIGLSARSQRRVFSRFYQVDRRLSRSTSGCGLGLSIVRSIAVAHGGTVAVESRLGQGSTFTITLPVAGGHLASRRAPGEEQASR